ncbi:MAG: thiosulfate oxidation carrier protein SoxY [Alphaproteobacteria bacterium]|nr:thiosulfate oxidation carrier protein SoxY [Alphaproteobacteria bacterium]
MTKVTKREFLIVATGAAAAALVGTPNVALSAERVQARIDEFLGGQTAQEGGLTLEMPEIAENGNTVPLSVSVDGEASENRYVESLLVLADGNPEPGVATFHFTPMSGEQRAATRMRLAKTQNVVALAKMNDGAVMKAETLVKVTIGGCGG